MKVFISYSREDAASAKKLCEALKAIPDVEPWLDSEQLLPGLYWEDEIMKAVRDSQLVVLLLSSRSVSKEGYVQKEMREALDRLATFPPGRTFIIPARIDECSPNHRELNRLHRVDLFPDWDEGLRLICKVIEKERPVRAPVLLIEEPENRISLKLHSRSLVEARLQNKGNLIGADMVDLDLAGIDLSGADLSGCSLVGADLSLANLTYANLKGANLERANLEGANLTHANLWGVNFWGASVLQCVGIEQAVLEHTNFYRTIGILSHLNGSVSLGDYDEFVTYFERNVGMSRKEIARTFIWLNHPYFQGLLSSPFGP